MSDPNGKTLLNLPAEKTSEKIKEPPDPNKSSDNEDDPEGKPDQPDGEK